MQLRYIDKTSLVHSLHATNNRLAFFRYSSQCKRSLKQLKYELFVGTFKAHINFINETFLLHSLHALDNI